MWDERNLRAELSSIPVGGGVWRIKQRQDLTLIAAMHGGFLVLRGADIVTRLVAAVGSRDL